jgi:hypothetical protein
MEFCRPRTVLVVALTQVIHQARSKRDSEVDEPFGTDCAGFKTALGLTDTCADNSLFTVTDANEGWSSVDNAWTIAELSSDDDSASQVNRLTCVGDASLCIKDNPATVRITDDNSSYYESCAYDQFTCITCYTDADTTEQMIRVQSNNMPSVCWQHNPANPNVAKTASVDFRVKFNH